MIDSESPQQRLRPQAIDGILHDAPDYRECLKRIIALWREQRALSLAQLSTKAGFSSRNYLSEILKGRRRITAKSMNSIAQVFKLKGTQKKVFQYLVALDHPDVLSTPLAQIEVQKRLTKYRNRILSDSQRPDNNNDISDMLLLQSFLPIFSSLGESAKGSTLEEVCHRTGLSKELVSGTLNALIQRDIIRFQTDTQRFHTSIEHLKMDELGTKKSAQKMYLSSLKDMQKAAERDFAHPESHFFTSVFSIREKDMPELKRRMKDLMFDFVDQNEEASGEKLIQLAVGLRPYKSEYESSD